MRRSQANTFGPNFSHASVGLEEENDALTDELKDKISLLRTLAIEMGQEVKYHHNMLDGLSDGMEHSQGFLGKTMDRVLKLGRGGHNYHMLYLFLFCILVFVMLWVMLKFR